MSGPGFLFDTIVAGLETNVAVLEAIAAQAQIDTAQAVAISTQLATLYNSIPGRVSQESGVDPTIASDMMAAAQTLAAAMPAAQAALLFGEAYDAAAPQAAQALTANAALDLENAALVLQLQRLALLSAYVQAVLSVSFAARQDALAARTVLVARFDVEFSDCGGSGGMDLYIALQTLRSAAIAYLTQLITTLQPVVTVRTPRVSSALWLAWRLYQDPTQASEIVARNKIAHPSFCPQTLEVLAPSAVS